VKKQKSKKLCNPAEYASGKKKKTLIPKRAKLQRHPVTRPSRESREQSRKRGVVSEKNLILRHPAGLGGSHLVHRRKEKSQSAPSLEEKSGAKESQAGDYTRRKGADFSIPKKKTLPMETKKQNPIPESGYFHRPGKKRRGGKGAAQWSTCQMGAAEKIKI